MDSKKEETHDPKHLSAIANPNIPKLYCNGFVSGYTMTDIFVMPMLNGSPGIVMSMPFSAAKSLIEGLQTALNEYEKITKTTTKTLAELERLKKEYNS